MVYLKIVNIVSNNGVIDYKGLNIDLFVPGSQVYPLSGNYCLLGTTQEVVVGFHEDVIVLTAEDYESLKNEFITSQPVLMDYEKEIRQLKDENLELQMALIEIHSMLLEVK
ncbi:hypothetical protein OM416_18105 [Paenibacillus sp. LS1]|uniref:hypothetical protein n=1 Tax=Paenibacillus sp. LS1 TaxID=2992120 RepID=UPI002231F121|nr:hypothetical protein [Paenibacillus sp. LS1]MCW3793511.1 hypothetical protein [Paenibacillus sp. LS1]